MNANIKNFYDLDAWKEARKLTESIYAITGTFPRAEVFGLTSQMRRASVSVNANLAEGFGRMSVREKLQYYNQAHGSLTELQSHLYISTDLNFIKVDDSRILSNQLTKVQAIIQGLLRSTRKRLK